MVQRFADVTADDPRFRALLAAAGLPHDDLAGEHKHYLGLADADGVLLAAGGLEVVGEHGLLRSLVVAEEARGAGLGRAVSAEIISRAQAQGMRRLYLMTNSAEAFFRHLGFTGVNRDSVPAGIAATSQFRGLTCRSAQVMSRALC